MNFRRTRAQLPKGVRDLYGDDALALRLLEARLLEGFRRRGYRDVAPPSFELHENMAVGLGEQLDRATFRFVDPDGALMSLRADFTNGIARLLATKLADEPRPVRVCYSGAVFRHERALWGKQREFHQAGVELVGAAGAAADVELVVLALETLEEAGLSGYRVNIGHVGLFKALFADAKLAPEELAPVREAIDDRDRGRVDELARELEVPAGVRDALLALTGLVGRREVVDAARPLSTRPEWHSALDRVAALLDGLAALDLDRHVLLDLGEVKGIEYYTGLLFEGFVPGTGFPVLSGGRYDTLHEQFGRSGAAVGFAVTLERMLLALAGAGSTPARDAWRVEIAPDQGAAAAAHRLARRLRARGADVTIALEHQAGPRAGVAVTLVGTSGDTFDARGADGTRLGAIEGGAPDVEARVEAYARKGRP